MKLQGVRMMSEQYTITTDLQKQINAIKLADCRAKKAVFEIAMRLALVADPVYNMLDGTGYANIVEFAADNFGYARSTTLNYCSIANKYLTYSGDKTKEIRTICARLNENGNIESDYKIGQLNALGKTSADDFRMLDSEGIISPDMSADKIKQAVRDFYADPEPDPEPDSEPDPEPDPPEQQDPHAITLSFAKIFRSVFSGEIGQRYKMSTHDMLTSIVEDLCNYEVEITYDIDDMDTYTRITLEDDITGVMIDEMTLDEIINSDDT